MLKLKHSIYCLKQAPAAFKDKLTTFIKGKNFTAVNDSGTGWILTQGSSTLITACNVDEVLHFTNDKKKYPFGRAQTGGGELGLVRTNTD